MRPGIWKIFQVVAIAALAVSCRGASAQSGNRTISLDVGGRTRTAILHVPSSYVEGSPVPLVIFMHGGGGSGSQAQRAYGMDPIADREGFLVVYPNGTIRGGPLLTWNAANCCAYAYENQVDDVAFLNALVDEIERTYSVDRARIYATGMSNGGMMAYRLGCRLSDRLAAIAPVAGALNEESCVPSSPVSVIVFHGTADEHVPYEGGFGSASLYPHEDRPVSYAVDFWVARNGCSTVPVTETSASGNIVKDTYGGGEDGSEVVLYTIRDGGHAWPGSAGSASGDEPTQEISASELIWEFFALHPKVSAPVSPAVRLVGPNGGERLRRGDTVEVAWSVDSASEIASTELWLSSDRGATYTTMIAGLTDPAARSFAWTIPSDAAKGKRYRIRVTVTTLEGIAASDESDANFRVKK